jgi:hypothetical protein
MAALECQICTIMSQNKLQYFLYMLTVFVTLVFVV